MEERIREARLRLYGPQIIYDPKPVQTPIDGISISSAQECDRCSLQVTPGISTSTIKLDRDFGDISRAQCESFKKDEQAVRDKKLTFADFKSRLVAGKYARPAGEGYCEQLALSQDDAATMKSWEDYASSGYTKITGSRIRKISTGDSFSRDTKLRITPSIPFKMTVGTRTIEPREILVKEMTLYHPSPVRIENVQHDAVLSLNDPASAAPDTVVVLIPIVSSGAQTGATEFMSKIVSQASSLIAPDPQTGVYNSIDVPTGADWTLNTLLPIDEETNQVKSGYFAWEGVPPLEQYTIEETRYLKHYGWRRGTGGAPMYAMLEKPVEISQSDLATLLQFPPTPPEEAIHGIIDGSLVYKCGPAETGTAVSGTTTKETFKNTCDPFRPNYDKMYGYTPDQMLGVLFNVLTFVAIAVGAWIALTMVGVYRSDTFFTNFADGMGTVIARFFKKSAEKLKNVSSTISALRTGPTTLTQGTLPSIGSVPQSLDPGALSSLLPKKG
jgi:hypothetical protein